MTTILSTTSAVQMAAEFIGINIEAEKILKSSHGEEIEALITNRHSLTDWEFTRLQRLLLESAKYPN